MDWRLGIDLGTNSLGWCAMELGPQGLPGRVLDLNSRIFSDGRHSKSRQSLAAARRAARAARRGQDRYKQRRAAVLKHLACLGLFPPEDDQAARAALRNLDPFALRARAISERIAPYELGRALFHLNQRRGFKSNRRTDRKDSDSQKESQKVQTGVTRLTEAMTAQGAATLGAYLHGRRHSATDDNHIPSVRARLRPEPGVNAKGQGYDLYPSRALLEREFHAIFDVQAKYHPALLTPAARARLFAIIFNQRDLKTPQVGLCTLLHHQGEERLPKAHPLFQRRRLLEEVNSLRIGSPGQQAQALTLAQRDIIVGKLARTRKATFLSLRRALKLDGASRFNKESESRPELAGHEVAATMLAKTRFGEGWSALSADAQWEIIGRIRSAQSEADQQALEEWLRQRHRLSSLQARAVADAPLPEGHGRFGETATRALIKAMEDEVIVYSAAVAKAGLGHHSDRRDGVIFDTLPYYGQVLQPHILPGTGDPNDSDETRYGKLSNPTVHIGLNQLRRVVNRLIERYGRPAEIVIELARELKLTEEEKRELDKQNKKNREAASVRSKKLGSLGIADKGSNRAMLKLWEELNPDNALDRRCIYSGEQISMAMLFSDEVEIDHILPFKDTLDDGSANRLVCMRRANQQKRKRTPFDAFGHTARWEEIAARAARLPKQKRWRFEPDALSRFAAEGGFLARHLVDTQYFSRLAHEYVGKLYADTGEGSSHVWVLPGRLTEMLRRSWGLNSLLPDHNVAGGADQPKNRLDHRHHAIDAAVIAVTDRALLGRIARETGSRGEEEARRLARQIAPPWEGFREDLRVMLGQAVISHRPDHGTIGKAGLPRGRDRTAGALHNATAYGLTGRKEKGLDLVVHRIPFESVQRSHLADTKRRVADPALRAALREATSGLPVIGDKKIDDKAFLQALLNFSQTDPRYGGIRRVRVEEPLSVIPITDRAGRPYKAFEGDSNYRCDIWELPDGSWCQEVISMFEAHQSHWLSRIRRDHHNPRKVLSLYQDDAVAIERGHGRELLRIVKFSSAQLVLAALHEGGPLKDRHPDNSDPFRYVIPAPNSLKRWKARQVRIDELGRVQDPGPPRGVIG